MDSLTHVIFGAAVGEVVMGKKIGAKAQLIGAIAGSFPDIDVFLTKFIHDDFGYFRIHRGYTHALFIHLFLALLLGWLCHIIFRRKYQLGAWYKLWIIGLVTHSLLDCCTTFGTQLFLPFSNYIVGFNNIAVVDPFFTLPFLVFIVWSLFYKKENPFRLKLNYMALGFAAIYMVFTLVNKFTVHTKFENQLKSQNITYSSLSTTPTMFNNFLWNAIATTPDSIYFGEYSLFQSRTNIEFKKFSKGNAYKSGYESDALSVLDWFSQGKYVITKDSDDHKINFFITKWGRAAFDETDDPKMNFRFYTTLIKNDDGTVSSKQVEPNFNNEDVKKFFRILYDRTFHY
ncbi:MAG: metal-dependent hydrolase [Saprospiraceae bacterium]|nr:metal-dependent hydrolase [Saprospiraceae bacterium]